MANPFVHIRTQSFVCVCVRATSPHYVRLGTFYRSMQLFLGVFARERQAPIRFAMSVRLSACINSAPAGRSCVKSRIGDFFTTYVANLVLINRIKIAGTLRGDRSSFCASLKKLFKTNGSTDARIQESRDPKAPRFDVARSFPVLFDCKRSPAVVTISSLSYVAQ